MKDLPPGGVVEQYIVPWPGVGTGRAIANATLSRTAMNRPLSKHYNPLPTPTAALRKSRRIASDDLRKLRGRVNSTARPITPEEQRQLWDASHQALISAAAQGLQDPVQWHALASLATDPAARLAAFTRVMEIIESETYAEKAPLSPLGIWTTTHLHATCQYEIALIHQQQGRLTEAKEHLDRAEPLTAKAVEFQIAANIMEEDPLPKSIYQLRQTLSA